MGGAGARWRHAGLALAVCAAAACARPVQLYEGPPRPDAEIALLAASGRTTVLEIDGRGVDRLEKHFALLPGVHEIAFRVRQGDAAPPVAPDAPPLPDYERRWRYDEPQRAAFDAPAVTWMCHTKVQLEPGGRYSVREWIEVEDDGRRISTIRIYDDESLAWIAPTCALAELAPERAE